MKKPARAKAFRGKNRDTAWNDFIKLNGRVILSLIEKRAFNRSPEDVMKAGFIHGWEQRVLRDQKIREITRRRGK